MTRFNSHWVWSFCTGAVCLTACSGPREGVDPDRGGSALYEPGEENPGGDTTNTLLFGENALSRHVSNADVDHEIEFFSGNGFFNQGWVQAPSSTEARDGLGPLFNARSCAGCHFRDGRGRPPLDPEEPLLSILFRLSVGQDPDGMPVGDPVYGGQIQPFAVGDAPAEANVLVTYEEISGRYPDGTDYTLIRPTYEIVDEAYGSFDDDIVVSPRVAPAMHGLGLLEAIPVARLEDLADETDEDQDGISGRIRLVPDRMTGGLSVGRFGWKNEQPSIRQQSAGAFLGDLGLTTELFPEDECTTAQIECREGPSGGAPEISPLILERIVTYSRLVAVPARANADDEQVLEGKRLFFDVGCADCHTPSHRTGEHEFEELVGQKIYPYTDLLLHDMGEGLSDGDGHFEVDREWRTPPLWALRYYPVVNDHDRLLHDGRARGVEEAILWHGGEAEASAERFRSLSEVDRALVVAFVESL